MTKVMGWDPLAEYLGEETLKRRVVELQAAVRDDSLAISPEEQAALDLSADYAAGNRPLSSFDRIMNAGEEPTWALTMRVTSPEHRTGDRHRKTRRASAHGSG